MHRFRLIGVPQLLAADGGGGRLERRDAALLAVLLLDGPQSRSKLAGLLWPNVSAERARNSLRQRLHRLRRACGVELVDDTGALALRAGIVEPFESALAALRADPEAPVGGLLDGMVYDAESELDAWLHLRREHWRRSLRDRLSSLAEGLQQQGEWAAALRHARRLIREDEAIETSHLLLMRMLYASGDASGALLAYGDAARALAASVAAPPGPALTSLRALALECVQAEHDTLPMQTLPDSLLRPPRLIGRDLERQRMALALARGRVVAIVGEAGMGKSRLLQEVARVRGWPEPVAARLGDAELPYALITRCLQSWQRSLALPSGEALRELQSLLGAAHPGAAAQPSAAVSPARILATLERTIDDWRRAPSAGPFRLEALAIDDLHLADAASLQLLLSLAADGRAEGPGWIVALLQDELPEVLARWYRRVDPRQVERIVLVELDEAGVFGLLDSLQLPGLDARLWTAPLRAHAGGRPFDLLDVLMDLHARGLRDFSIVPDLTTDAPRRREATARQMRRLDDTTRALVQVAAVAGPDFGVELAAAVIGQPCAVLASRWRVLERAGLFSGEGFADDRVREVAVAELPDVVARALHRQVAHWLEGGGAQPPHASAARIAAHWQAGADGERAAPAFEAAACEARQRGANLEERQALEAAAAAYRTIAQPAALDRARDCDARRVHALLRDDRQEQALALAETLVIGAQTDRARDTALEARALARLQADAFAPALADARELLDRPRDSGAGRLRLLAAQHGAVALRRIDRPLDGVSMMEAERAGIGQLDEAERLQWMTEYAATLEHAGRRRDGLAVIRQVASDAESRHRWAAAGEAWASMAHALEQLNRVREGLQAARRAVACAGRAGSGHVGRSMPEVQLAGGLRDLGEFREYLPLARRLPGTLREAGHDAWALGLEDDLAIAWAWLGRFDLAHRALTPLGHDATPLMRVARLLTQARLLRLQPVPDGRRARALVERAGPLAEVLSGRLCAPLDLKMAFERARGDISSVALDELARIESQAHAREMLALAAQARFARLELLIGLGRGAESRAVARDVLSGADAEGIPPGIYAPELWWRVATTLQTSAAGEDADAAGRAWRQAREWILDRVLPQLPEEHRSSFLGRNAVNAAVLQGTRLPA